MKKKPDLLTEITIERTKRNPKFPKLVKKAAKKLAVKRGRKS